MEPFLHSLKLYPRRVLKEIHSLVCDGTGKHLKKKNRKTCHKNVSGTTIGIMLTERPNCFQKMSTIVTGLSDFYKMIISCLKTKFHQKRLFSEIIKSLMNKIFCTILINKWLRENFIERKICTKAFQIHLKLNKHAPLKEKIV